MTIKTEKFGTYALNPLMKMIREKALSSSSATDNKRGYARFLRHWSELVKGVYDIEYHDFLLRLYPADNACDNTVYRSGYHREEDELAILRNFEGKDLVFVDIGANVGMYSLTANRYFGAQSKIFAFEPFAETFEKLQFNLQINKADRVKAYPVGISDYNGQEELFIISGRNAGQHSTNEDVAARSGASDLKISIQVRLLAEILKSAGVVKVDILKMDIEGSEDKALLPYLKSTERKNWPVYIMMEVGNRNLWKDDCIDFLLANDYEIAFDNTENMHFQCQLSTL